MTGFSSYRTKCNAHLILPKCTLAIDQVRYTERGTSGPSDLATGDSNGEIARCKHKVTIAWLAQDFVRLTIQVRYVEYFGMTRIYEWTLFSPVPARNQIINISTWFTFKMIMHINHFFSYRLPTYRCSWKKYNCEAKFYLLNKKITIIQKHVMMYLWFKNRWLFYCLIRYGCMFPRVNPVSLCLGFLRTLWFPGVTGISGAAGCHIRKSRSEQSKTPVTKNTTVKYVQPCGNEISNLIISIQKS